MGDSGQYFIFYLAEMCKMQQILKSYFFSVYLLFQLILAFIILKNYFSQAI